MNMVNFILIIVAFKITGSNAAVSGIVLSFIIPAILFGLVAGVYVDRWNKKQVLLWTNLIRTLLLVLLALWHTDLIIIYIVSFAIAIVTQFFIPAETPIIPQLVKKDLLLPANAMFGMGLYGSIVVAYALSGPFLIFFGETYVFIVLAVLFLLAAFCISFIRDSALKKNEKTVEVPQRITVMEEIKSAFKLVMKTKTIFHSLCLLTLSQLLILLLAVIGPGFASQILGVTVDAFPLLFVTPAAIGMVIGALILANIPHAKFSKDKSATTGVIISGLAILLMPYGSKVASRGFIQVLNANLPSFLAIDILPIMIFIAFVLGFANALVFVPSNTILQEETSDEYRGRIYGALNAMVGIFSLFPVIVVGGLADTFGVSSVLTGIGISIIMIGIIRMMFSIKKKI